MTTRARSASAPRWPSSLNVPAVRALMLDGVDDFRDRLWDMGYRGLTEDGDYYGFSLALGSAEVTLLEQAAAYRALGDGGRYLPLRLTMDAPAGERHPVMTPAAAWIVADMIADADARAVTFGIDSALRLPFWAAAKTGTSKAMRDNWCIGFSDRFTVAVWVGNAEGDSMTRVSGTSGAAPVWREVMLALHRDRPGPRAGAAARDRSPHRALRRRYRAAARRLFPRRHRPGDARRRRPPPRAARASSPRCRARSMRSIPTFPLDRQRIRFAAIGATAGGRWRLDTRDLGRADTSPAILPPPGTHRLTLVAADGRALDQVLFTVH